MQLVEQHNIQAADPRWSVIDTASFLSKNLYNAANYLLRQEFIFNHHYISYIDLDKLMKQNPDYCALPRKVSQQVLRQLDKEWQSFFAALFVWKNYPIKFTGRPRLPRYKHKTTGRNLLVYTDQAVSGRLFRRKGLIRPSQLDITIATQQSTFDQVRIVPHKTHYVVEVVYTVEMEPLPTEAKRIASVDIGVDNLATVTFNQPGFSPLLVNGKPLKSINHWYNKQKAKLQSQLKGERKSSKRLDVLTDRRNRQIDAYLHLASRRLIDVLCLWRIGTLVIGKNNGWKQKVHMGKRNNQNFVQIPHARFIDMLTYKAAQVGINVLVSEESYTSKCSFLDLEPIGKHEAYAGRRVKRWLFIASDGRKIHADVNGSYNIMRKVIPNAFEAGGIWGAVVHPLRVTPV